MLAIAVGVLLTLAKLPLLFTTLGEQDHGRLIMDAIVYANDGRASLHTYGILTSPLWVLAFAGLTSLLGPAKLVLWSNAGGLVCGGLTTVLAVILLRQLGASRSWASAGGAAAGLVPAMFYLSVYGYPTQYAFPFLLGSAIAFVRALETRKTTWLVMSWCLYALLVLVKIDFALAGTLLLSVAIVLGRERDRRAWVLVAFPFLAFGVTYVFGRLIIASLNVIDFLTGVQGRLETAALLDSSSMTVAYACGFGTLALLIAAIAAGFVRQRATAARVAAAWVVGVVPLWLFWLRHPPMSSRHAAPGALITVLLAALVASTLLRKPRYAAVWLVLVVALNWPFGEPNLDFNYNPSGKLLRTVSVNRRAFAVGDAIGRQVAERQESYKVILGSPHSDVLGGIDFVPAICVAMAKTARSVHPSARYVYSFKMDGRQRTILHPYARASDTRHLTQRHGRVGYYAPWRTDLEPLTKMGVEVTTFDPNSMFEQMSGDDR